MYSLRKNKNTYKARKYVQERKAKGWLIHGGKV